LSAVREMEIKQRPMFMVMSSFDSPRLEKETLSAGATYYFLKPFNVDINAFSFG